MYGLGSSPTDGAIFTSPAWKSLYWSSSLFGDFSFAKNRNLIALPSGVTVAPETTLANFFRAVSVSCAVSGVPSWLDLRADLACVATAWRFDSPPCPPLGGVCRVPPPRWLAIFGAWRNRVVGGAGVE